MKDAGSGSRWTDAEIYRAINDALLTWYGRVSVPHVYVLPDGWTAGTYEYALPDYINARSVVPQMRSTRAYDSFGELRTGADVWVDIPGWRIEPEVGNGRILKFDISPYSSEARLLWFGHNGMLPISAPVTSGSTAADATSMILAAEVDCYDYGWVKVNGEWMQFAGVTRGSTTTLQRLVRGMPQGKAAAVHNDGSTALFGVAMPRLELYKCLLDQVAMNLHELFLGTAAPRETQLHQQMVGFYQDRIRMFWRSWQPTRQTRIVIDRSMGVM